MVLLVANYAPDRQQSMLRFSAMMQEGLAAAGLPVELIAPQPFFGTFSGAGNFAAKWLAYVDKFLLFPLRLRREVKRRGASVVHICDHSNAVYVSHCKSVPVVVTCHDLLAVRGALGEATDCPASFTGRGLQRWILRGLARADAVVCVSRATLADAKRLIGNSPALKVVISGLNYPYRKLPDDESDRRITAGTSLDSAQSFVLHVGSNLKRKNRAGVLRIFASAQEKWDGRLVFAGDPMTPELQLLARELRVSDRIIEVPYPESPLLEALYNRATALIFPSSFEGFGWPIAEAQACGCPVICTDSGPMPEVAGEGALLHSIDDEDGMAADLLRLTESAARAEWSERSLRNAERFSTARMIAEYVEIYRSLASPPERA